MKEQTIAEIAAIPDLAERENAIRLRMFEVFDEVRAMATAFNRDATVFIEQYKMMRRAQKAYFDARKANEREDRVREALLHSKQLEAELDKFAARLAPKQEQTV